MGKGLAIVARKRFMSNIWKDDMRRVLFLLVWYLDQRVIFLTIMKLKQTQNAISESITGVTNGIHSPIHNHARVLICGNGISVLFCDMIILTLMRFTLMDCWTGLRGKCSANDHECKADSPTKLL
ncbi:hypothetical protein M0802_009792 [Mischocyttarus mexicanus]|nr:hypothetical protein M0802_009792 [Mischocyttarus mexicanus]